jgi:cytochrome c553
MSMLLVSAALWSASAGDANAAEATPAVQAAPRFEDSIAQRMQACTGCHGAQGRAGPDGYYPRIAGKPAGYLYNQLLNFRDGRRQYAIMTNLLDPLSDDYLKEIATYFSSLDLPYPPPAPPGTPTAAILERGKQLVREGDATRQIPACVQCHGQAMTGVAPAIPGLLGLPRDYLAGQLGSFRTGTRNAHAPDCMQQVSQRLSTEDVGAVTQWLSSQAVPEHAKPAPRLVTPLPTPCGGVPGPVAEGAVDESIPNASPGSSAASGARP